MFDVHVEGDLSPEAILREFGLEENGAAQVALDNAVVEYAKQYWAWDTGHLANSAVGIGTGNITYTAPYAYEMYYGVREDGTPINYHLDKNPLAGPYPIDRMKADHMNDIVEEVMRVVGNQ